jgi:N-acetyl-gamma-glutamyl-phosphate reductase
MPRGILATITSKTSVSAEQFRDLYREAYAKERFVSLLEPGLLPETSSLNGSNSAHLQVAVDPHTSRAVISIAIDNLGKGAAGQALQNANIICGIDEASGLDVMGVGQ